MTVSRFGKRVNLTFRIKGNIVLSNKGFILREIEVAREFNTHFQSTTSSLGLFK